MNTQRIWIEKGEENDTLYIRNGDKTLSFVLERKVANRWKREFQSFLKNEMPFDTMFSHAEILFIERQ